MSAPIFFGKNRRQHALVILTPSGRIELRREAHGAVRIAVENKEGAPIEVWPQTFPWAATLVVNVPEPRE